MTRDIQIIRFLGHGYDPIYLDRTKLTEVETTTNPAHATGVKLTSPFQRVHSEHVGGNVPKPDKLTHEATINTVKVDEKTNVISSSYEYSEKVSTSVHASAGIEGLFSSSRSVEWSKIKGRIEKSDETTVISTGYKRLFSLTLDTHKIDVVGAGANEVPHLDPAFKSALAGADAGMETFRAFVLKYGTHFAAGLVMGGSFEEEIRITSRELTTLEANNVNVSASAQATLKKKIEVEGSIEVSTEISQEWKTFYEKEERSVRMAGGSTEQGLTLAGWLDTVRRENAVVVEVSLLPHHALMAAAYFPDLTESQRQQKRAALERLTLAYFEEHGHNLGASRVYGRDVVYLVPLQATPGPVDASVETPDMLRQPEGATAQVEVSNIREPRLDLFKQDCLKPGPAYARHKHYLWRVVLLDDEGSTAEIKPGSRIRLINLATERAMDAQGIRDYQGKVSAGTGVGPALVDAAQNRSDVWTFRSTRPSADPVVACDSGAHMAFYRAYDYGNPMDPRGCLRVHEKKAFSNGSNLITGAALIVHSCAYRLTKVG